MTSTEENARKILDTAFDVFMEEQRGEKSSCIDTQVGSIVESMKVILLRNMGADGGPVAPWACKECG